MSQLEPSPAQSTAAAASGTMVEGIANCSKCGYSLVGLPMAGLCPECGQAVVDSLRGFLLQYAAPEYINKVRSGHSLILNGILLQILFMIVSVFVTVAAGAMGPSAKGAPILVQGGAMVCALIILLGYLKATELDPTFIGTDKPTGARNVVRIAAIAQMVLSVPGLLLELVKGGSIDPGLLMFLSGAVGILSMVAWAVQFFAMMLYSRWLASRVPDQWIVKRTKTYMWLLPVLTTVGVLLVGLGPLIALILYWNLLDRVRKHLKSIEKSGVPANLKNMAG